MLTDAGRSNDFRLLDRELYLTATDLDTTERIVFGEEELARRADLEGGRSARLRCRSSTSRSS